MPAMFVVGIVGAFQVFKRRADASVSLLRVPLLGAISILGGVLLVSYIAPRYTVEFVPSLLISSIVGMSVILDRSARWSARRRRAVLAGIGALAMFGFVANFAIATTSARVAEGGASLRALVALQNEISHRTGHTLDGWVTVGDAVPDRSQPDRVFIIGECDLMLVGTGDLFDPWVPIEMRPVRLDIEFGDHQSEGRAVLARFGDDESIELSVEILDFQYRLALTGTAGGFSVGEWLPATPGTQRSIDITAEFDHGVFIVESRGQLFASVSDVAYGQDAIGSLLPLKTTDDDTELARLDVDVTVSRGEATSLCRELYDSAA